MSKPIIRIHNTETNQVIDREMTDEEFAEHEADKATELARKTQAEAKVTAKSALLSKLGITAEEAALLLS